MSAQNAKPTPGPWHVGRKVARMVYATNGTPICECDSMEESEDLVTRVAEMELANARLTAAAPDLLEALVNLSGWVGRVVVPTYSSRKPIPDNLVNAMSMASAALAKAEGSAA